MVHFKGQPCGLVLFLRPASLLVTCVGPLYYAPSASLERKNSVSSGNTQASTDPYYTLSENI